MRYTFFTCLVSIIFLFNSCSNSPKKNRESDSYLRIVIANDPISIDPRLVRDLPSSSVMHMLFEGLMRTTNNGKVIPGIAAHVSISNDQKKYTFYLRPSEWSDGSPLTAFDFAETWKIVLSPNFPAPNAYQLYMIKGAKLAKEGKASLESIGVKAIDSQTLTIELEEPTPYFLEMVSCHFFFPVHQSLRDPSNKQTTTVISNGPFSIDKWIKRSEFNVVKNPHYWDAENVMLAGISLHVLDEHTALQLFKAGQLDWIGSPLSTIPQDAIIPLKQQNKLQIEQGAGTHWFRINTHNPPFNNEKMRRAFALGVNRQAIVDHVTQGNQQPAIGIIPPSFGLAEQKFYSDNAVTTAQTLFDEALAEEGITKNQLPKIILSYASDDRNHKIAQTVQQQWNKTFGINVILNGNEPQVQLDKVKQGHYQLGVGSWYADIQDPINFLEIFKFQDNPTNQTFWHNNTYTALLDLSSREPDPLKRQKILADAESILMQGMPVIPLFYSAYNYLKSDRVENVYFSPLGYLDFKGAYLKEKEKSLSP